MISGRLLQKVASRVHGQQVARICSGGATGSSCSDRMHPFESSRPVAPIKDDLLETDAMLDALFSRRMPLLSLSGGLELSAEPASYLLAALENNEATDPNRSDAASTPAIYAMNRNARKPKKSNKGNRPCSRVSRRRKKEKFGNRKR